MIRYTCLFTSAYKVDTLIIPGLETPGTTLLARSLTLVKLLEGSVIASLDRLSEETPLVRPSFGGKCVSIRWIYGTDFQPSSGI